MTLTTQNTRRNLLIERLATALAFGSLLCVILLPSKPRLWQEALGDFKLVYASASGLMHTGDAYGYAELSRVFREAGVVQPADWFGHNPVYPFFTLIIISPLLLLPMLPAAYAWGCMDYVVISFTTLRLMKYAERRFGLGLGWRLALLAFVAASPLVSFALELANLSLLAACLCIFAVTAEPEETSWWSAAALAMALLLKPHLAFWVVLALFLVPGYHNGHIERKTAWRASLLFAVALVPMILYLAARHQFLPLMASYLDMLHREAVGGSMDFRNHQAFEVPAQITAFGMLMGYWIHSLHAITLLQFTILPPLGLVLVWASLQLSPDWKPVLVSAWVVFGFLVTYHRAHDGIVLFLFVPWALARLRNCWCDTSAWAVLLLYALFSVDVPREWWRSLATTPFIRPVADLLFDRQVATAAALLCVTLTLLLLHAALRRPPLTAVNLGKP